MFKDCDYQKVDVLCQIGIWANYNLQQISDVSYRIGLWGNHNCQEIDDVIKCSNIAILNK